MKMDTHNDSISLRIREVLKVSEQDVNPELRGPAPVFIPEGGGMF